MAEPTVRRPINAVGARILVAFSALPIREFSLFWVPFDPKLRPQTSGAFRALEREFGPLHKGMTTKAVVQLRQLERHLFRAWCRCGTVSLRCMTRSPPVGLPPTLNPYG